jgi:DNA-binding NtrC family response regulator
MTTFPMPPNYADHVLVASPSSVVRQRVLESLLPSARRVEQASGGAEALVHLEKGSWQVLFLDRRLPDLDAEELSATVRKRYPAVEVVLLDTENDVSASVAESPAEMVNSPWSYPRNNRDQTGAASSDNKIDPKILPNIDRNIDPDISPNISGNISPNIFPDCDRYEDKSPSRNRPVIAAPSVLPGMIGHSAIMQPVYRMVRLVASRDTTVLITGPTGTGKELVARALHQLSPRSAHTLAVVNCAAIPESLLEAELFGYSRGAFTGALQSYAGRIQAAHLGTLFLDEIGDMPLSLQPKLLRFLEQKELQRLGSSQVVRVDVRVVSATNVDLLTLVREGKFREDLYYRLSAFPLAIPPLRDRPEDVLQLAEHFLQKFSPGPPTPVLSDEALGLLQTENWRGNIRELQNVIERALILAADQPVIRPVHLMLADPGFRSCLSTQ